MILVLCRDEAGRSRGGGKGGGGRRDDRLCRDSQCNTLCMPARAFQVREVGCTSVDDVHFSLSYFDIAPSALHTRVMGGRNQKCPGNNGTAVLESIYQAAHRVSTAREIEVQQILQPLRQLHN